MNNVKRDLFYSSCVFLIIIQLIVWCIYSDHNKYVAWRYRVCSSEVVEVKDCDDGLCYVVFKDGYESQLRGTASSLKHRNSYLKYEVQACGKSKTKHRRYDPFDNDEE